MSAITFVSYLWALFFSYREDPFCFTYLEWPRNAVEGIKSLYFVQYKQSFYVLEKCLHAPDSHMVSLRVLWRQPSCLEKQNRDFPCFEWWKIQAFSHVICRIFSQVFIQRSSNIHIIVLNFKTYFKVERKPSPYCTWYVTRTETLVRNCSENLIVRDST